MRHYAVSEDQYGPRRRRIFVFHAECPDRSSTPNIVRRASQTRRVPTRSIILIVRPLAHHASDVLGAFDRQGHTIIRVRELIVIVNRSIVAYAFDQIDRSLAAPTNGPMSTTACGYKNCFA